MNHKKKGLIFLLLMVLTGCQSPHKAPQATLPVFEHTTAKPRTLTEILLFEGTLSEGSTTEIKAEISGTVTEIFIKPNQNILKDTPLALIQNQQNYEKKEEITEDIEKLEKELKFKEKEKEMYKEMYLLNTISKQQFETILSNTQSLRQELNDLITEDATILQSGKKLKVVGYTTT